VSYLVMALHGRLGNNLWQSASGLGIARTLGADLVFDSRRVREPLRLLPDLLGDHYEEATPAQLRQVGVLTSRPGIAPAAAQAAFRRSHDLGRRVRGKGPALRLMYNDEDRYRDDLFSLDLPAYVGGFFEDERFFSTVADEVAERIRWPEGTVQLPAELHDTVAVSFRRGDFNVFEAGLPLEYYDRAMRQIAKTVSAPTYVIFGDDPAFVEMFVERAEHRGHVAVSGLAFGRDPITQLRLLSECEHAVLSNSTFAWWGAWLGDRRGDPDRAVIAPTWFDWKIRHGWTVLEEVPGTVTTYDLSTWRRSAASS
jgi:hypothetical protein